MLIWHLIGANEELQWYWRGTPILREKRDFPASGLKVESMGELRLGIIVVYVFEQAMQPMFDLHLSRLRRHTRLPFRIYGAGHKLPAEQWQHVSSAPEIILPNLNIPRQYLEDGVRTEHAYCLARLAEYAFADGCTHVIAMHLDSFPIRDGWEDGFLAPIEDGTSAVVSIVPNGYSAGLCWSKKFKDLYQPPMLIDAETRVTSEFANFVAEFPSFDHIETGLGVIFTAYRNGLGWTRIGTDDDRKIYGGLVFHMVGATHKTFIDVQPVRNTFATQLIWSLVGPLARRLPRRIGRAIRGAFIDKDRADRDGSLNSKAAENAALMADPHTYLRDLVQRYSGEIVPTRR